MLESGERPTEKTVAHLDRCLSCLSCETTCAIQLDYRHLIGHAQAHIETHYRRPLGDRTLRWLIAAVLPRAERVRIALRLGRATRTLARWLPRRLRSLCALVPTDNDDVPAPRAGVYPAVGESRKRVVLLTGCVQSAIANHITAAALRVLTRHGCEVIITPRAKCCGALTLHMGKEAAARTDARACIAAWTEAEVDAVIVTASGCGTTIKDYGRLFDTDPQWREQAADIGVMTRDIAEFLDTLDLQVSNPQITAGLPVAYHDACSLQHGQKLTRTPRRLLEGAGFLVRDVPEKHFCCGSAGTYNILQPVLAEQLGTRKAAHIETTGAPIIATGNLGCMRQLALYTTLPIIHTVELIDWGERRAAPTGAG